MTEIGTQERVAWWRLSRTDTIGPITFFKLIERYGTAVRAIEALPGMARRGGRKAPLVVFAQSRAEDEIAALEKIGAQMIAACEHAYPAYLKQIDDAPPVLSVRGNISLFNRPCVGIVGARNASLTGRKMAMTLARDLGAAGYAVVSGLARGIDTAVHEGSLSSGTVAVLAGGVDHIYPPENARLYHDIIAQGGAIISEQPAGTVPTAMHFPRRNRLISGLSLGVVVVEATLKSGSLITARLAAEQGREVFAMPGSPLDPRAAGPNALIRDGAHLIEHATHIISALAPLKTSKNLSDSIGKPYDTPLPEVSDLEVDRARTYIYGNLSPTPVTVDELVRACLLSSPVVQTALLELELAGHIERLPGNRVALISKEELSDRERFGHC